MSDATNAKPLRFPHIGNLHLTEAGLQNHRDLNRIIDAVNTHVRFKLRPHRGRSPHGRRYRADLKILRQAAGLTMRRAL
jgi:hypothetical protein